MNISVMTDMAATIDVMVGCLNVKVRGFCCLLPIHIFMMCVSAYYLCMTDEYVSTRLVGAGIMYKRGTFP